MSRHQDNQTPANSRQAYDVSTDDQRFVMAEGADSGIPQIVVVLNWLEERKRLVPRQ